tara:strand:- start:526 stop:702 length:177 start_codon:yes stop_codon:yes gene_type:complete
MKRYIVEVSYFVWADSDEQAKEIAEKKCRVEQMKHDNRCSVEKILQNDFGSFHTREVK